MIGCWSLAELTKSNCSACWFKEALQSKTCFEVQYHHTGMLGPLGNGHFSLNLGFYTKWGNLCFSTYR